PRAPLGGRRARPHPGGRRRPHPGAPARPRGGAAPTASPLFPPPAAETSRRPHAPARRPQSTQKITKNSWVFVVLVALRSSCRSVSRRQSLLLPFNRNGGMLL